MSQSVSSLRFTRLDNVSQLVRSYQLTHIRTILLSIWVGIEYLF